MHLLLSILSLAITISNAEHITIEGLLLLNKGTEISDTAYLACIEYGNQYGICPELLMAIIERESNGDAYAVNGSCKGLMQISEKWHTDRMERLGVTDLFDERGNILVGTDYIAELAAEYGGDVALVLDIYNGNSNAYKNAAAGIISDYAEDILTNSERLERAHGK